MVAYFYDDDGLLVTTSAAITQQAFHILIEIFKWVGLRTNVRKTVIVEFQPCRAIGGHSTEDDGLRMTGEGRTHWVRLRQGFQCLD